MCTDWGCDRTNILVVGRKNWLKCVQVFFWSLGRQRQLNKCFLTELQQPCRTWSSYCLIYSFVGPINNCLASTSMSRLKFRFLALILFDERRVTFQAKRVTCGRLPSVVRVSVSKLVNDSTVGCWNFDLNCLCCWTLHLCPRNQYRSAPRNLFTTPWLATYTPLG